MDNPINNSWLANMIEIATPRFSQGGVDRGNSILWPGSVFVGASHRFACLVLGIWDKTAWTLWMYLIDSLRAIRRVAPTN